MPSDMPPKTRLWVEIENVEQLLWSPYVIGQTIIYGCPME